MSEFLPFKALRYNAKPQEYTKLIAPPYDVISPALQESLYERDEHNIVRLELSRDLDPYFSAHEYYEAWKNDGSLIVEDAPGFYVHFQTFSLPGLGQLTRRGVLGRLKLTPYSSGDTLPHERTLSGPKQDRLKLMEATKANISPIFGLIDDEQLFFDHILSYATVHSPIADADEKLPDRDVVRNTVWRLSNPDLTSQLERLVASKKVIIADGHHRYETALAFAEAHPELPGAQFMLVYLANLRSEGMTILPTHRVLHSADGFDQLEFLAKLKQQFTLDITDKETGLGTLNSDTSVVTLLSFPEEPHWVLLRDKNAGPNNSALAKLPAYRIQEEIIKPMAGITQKAIDLKTNLLYPHSVEEFDQMVQGHDWNVAFFLRPVSADEIISVTQEGSYMPQKSTYFYPKLPAGLVIHDFTIQA
jgi:uncharacterized protein (DUF1015 family)